MKTYEVELRFFDNQTIQANSEEEALEKAFAKIPKEVKDQIFQYFSNQSYATEIERVD